MRSRLTPLIKLFYNPQQAMIEISAGTPYVFGAIIALFATFAYYELLGGNLFATFAEFNRGRSVGMTARFIIIAYRVVLGMMGQASPILFLIVVFVPACLLATSLIHRRASFSVMLSQEYAPLIACVLYSWAAAHIIMLIPAILFFQPEGPNQPELVAALRLVPLPYFIFLVVLAARTVLKVGVGGAAGVVALGSLSLIALPLLPRLSFILT